jgi:hypothetical protein
MTPADLADLRLRAQRIAATTFTRPAEVVAWLGAVQAQDYLGALWAVGLRLTRAREQDVERALAEGSIVRTWPMRGTLHFVAAADARWMIELLAPKVVAGAARRFRQLGLDAATLLRSRRVLEKRLEGGRRLTRPAVYETLERAKISMAGQRGIHVLWRLAQDCAVCFGPREGKQQTLVLFDEWLPRAKPLPRDEALAGLAVRYFTGHGPATLADFAWWSGLRIADARAAVHLAGKRLVEESVDGTAHWFAAIAAPFRAGSPPSPRPARGLRRPHAHLLPAFDEFLVGYADRSAVLEPTRKLRVNDGGGILKPTIVVDGRVVGTWKRSLARGRVLFSPAPFAPLGKPEAQAVASALGRYADFLGIEAEWTSG